MNFQTWFLIGQQVRFQLIKGLIRKMLMNMKFNMDFLSNKSPRFMMLDTTNSSLNCIFDMSKAVIKANFRNSSA